MNYSQLVQLYFERSNALQWYWTLYVVVIGGVLAFSSMRQRRSFITTLLVSILYGCFAYKNLGAIHDVTMQRYAVLETIRNYAPKGNEATDVTPVRATLEPTLVAPDYGGIRSFHVTCDVLTIAALWAMERRRSRKIAVPVPV